MQNTVKLTIIAPLYRLIDQHLYSHEKRFHKVSLTLVLLRWITAGTALLSARLARREDLRAAAPEERDRPGGIRAQPCLRRGAHGGGDIQALLR